MKREGNVRGKSGADMHVGKCKKGMGCLHAGRRRKGVGYLLAGKRNKGMAFLRAGAAGRFLAWVMAFVMVAGLVMVPAGKVNAEGVDGMSVSWTKGGNSNDYWFEYYLTITNNTGAAVTGIEMIFKTSGEVSPTSYCSDLSATYDASAGGIRVYYSGTIQNGSSKVFSSSPNDDKIAMGKAITSGYVSAINKEQTIVTDNDPNLEVEYNYAKLLQYSLYLYDANMCGCDVDESCALSWRGDCHTGDSSVTKNINGTSYTFDVSGGYHDAGDHVKFGLPQAYAASVLGLGYVYYKDAYDELSQTEHLQNILRRFAEYFKRCTIMDSNGNVVAFCYQVGDGNADHGYWGPAEEQESKTGERDNYVLLTDGSNQCTDIVAESAAALAIYAYNFKDNDSKCSEYLNCAKKLIGYAESMPMAASGSAAGTGSFYSGSSYNDDLALACIWIHNAIGSSDTEYLDKYNNYVKSCSDGWLLSWDDVSAAAFLAGGSSYNAKVNSIMDSKKAKDVTPQGFTCVDGSWGSARYNTALQFTGMVYDKLNSTDTYTSWAESQMQYLLGNNNAHQCFVIGYNQNDPKHPHHRTASGYDDVNNHAEDPMKYMLYGALVGGPNGSDTYVDKANEYQYAEVAIDYNAAFVGAAAALYLKNKSDGIQCLVGSGMSDVKIYYTEGAGVPVKEEKDTVDKTGDKKDNDTDKSDGDTDKGDGSGTGNDGGSDASAGGESGTETGSNDDAGKVNTDGGSDNSGQGNKDSLQPVKASDMTLAINTKGVNGAPISGTYKLALKKSVNIAISFSPEGSVSENVTVISSNPKIVAVSGMKITGKKAGSAKVTVTSEGGLSKTINVKVMKKPVKKVRLKTSKKTLKVGKTLKLKASTSPSKKKAGNALYWKSSNEGIATVTNKGVVKGIGKGKVKITATALDGSGKKVSLKITVK